MLCVCSLAAVSVLVTLHGVERPLSVEQNEAFDTTGQEAQALATTLKNVTTRALLILCLFYDVTPKAKCDLRKSTTTERKAIGKWFSPIAPWKFRKSLGCNTPPSDKSGRTSIFDRCAVCFTVLFVRMCPLASSLTIHFSIKNHSQ